MEKRGDLSTVFKAEFECVRIAGVIVGILGVIGGI